MKLHLDFKIYVLMLLLTLSSLSVQAQSQTVNINVKNATLKHVFNIIEKQTPYRFSYRTGVIDNRSDVTISKQQATVPTVLNLAFKGRNLKYDIISSTSIVITRAEKIAEASRPVAEASRPVAEKNFSGYIKDDAGEPIIGASILVKGTSTGAITDLDGHFIVNAPTGSILVITYLGYKSVEVKVGNGPITISLEKDLQNLDEVVVIGYGSVKRSDLTGSASSRESNQITMASSTNAVDAMQGKIVGVNITRNAARPGGSYSINVRGINSINNNQGPLWVIDGIPTNSDARDLNPADIEKIDVLKDASATAIYGSRGAGGVVIVTTKRGKSGKPSINYDGYVGARVATHLPEMMNGEQYVQYRTDLFNTLGRSVDRSNAQFFTPDEWNRIDNNDYTDWVDLTLRTGLQYSNTLTASGGDEKGMYTLSIGQLHEEGTVRDQGFDRYNMHLSLNRKLDKHWEMGGSLYFTYSKQNEGSYEGLRSAFRLPPVAYPYDSDGNPQYHVFNSDVVSNPLLESSKDGEHRENKRYRIFGNVNLQYKPIEGLTFKTSLSPEMLYTRKGIYIGVNAKNSNGRASTTNAEYHQSNNWGYVWDNQVTYEKTFGKHNFAINGVQSLQYENWEYSDQVAKNFPFNSEWYNLDAAALSDVSQSATDYQQRTLASFLGRVQYTFNDRYLFTLSGRYDGSSRLADGNKWSFFPSAAFAWRMTEEPFLKDVKWLSNMKFRLSYGVTGNDAVSIYGTQSGVSQKYYDFGGTTVTSYYKDGLANKQLTWEKTNEINIGLDFGFLNSRINGSIDLYQRDAKDLIMKRNIPATSGWTSIWDNIGSVRNKGIEIGLNTVNIQSKNFNWTTNITFSYNKNEILTLYGEKKDDVGNRWFIGRPVRVNYDYQFDGIWQSSEAEEAAKYGQSPGQVKVKDVDGNGIINSNDKVILGQQDPKWIGSITNTFNYHNFDLSVYIYTQQGAQLQDAFMSSFMTYDGNYKQVNADYWTPNNPSTTFPQPGNKGKYYDSMRYISVSFVRVGSITLGYNFPKSLLGKAKINNLRAYFTTNNPFLFTSYKGFDPEWASQNTWGTATSFTTYIFGLKLDF